MKDAFGENIDVGDKVIYRSKWGYVIGKISELIPSNPKNELHWSPDRVVIIPIKNASDIVYSKNPILDANNVVSAKTING